MKWRVAFDGGDDLARQLAQRPDKLSRQVIVKALKAGGVPIRDLMAAKAPREPGAPDIADNIGISLANRIGSVEGGRWRARDETEHAVAVGPTKGFFYGIFQEYGTVHHGAQPFARPAFDEGAPRALDIIADELWWALRRGLPSGRERFVA